MTSFFSLVAPIALLFLILSITPHSKSFAGGDRGGNGGGALVCRTEKGEITYAEMYDLYQYRNLGFDHSSLDSYQKILEQIKNVLETTHFELFREFNTNLEKINTMMIEAMTRPKRSMPVIGDFLTIDLPKVCPGGRGGVPRYELVVNYRNDGMMDIDDEILRSFSQLSLASLYSHEVIYKIRRDYFFDLDSARARTLNALIVYAAVHPSFDRNIFYTSVRNELNGEPMLSIQSKLLPELQQNYSDYFKVLWCKREKQWVWEKDVLYDERSKSLSQRINGLRSILTSLRWFTEEFSAKLPLKRVLGAITEASLLHPKAISNFGMELQNYCGTQYYLYGHEIKVSDGNDLDVYLSDRLLTYFSDLNDEKKQYRWRISVFPQVLHEIVTHCPDLALKLKINQTGKGTFTTSKTRAGYTALMFAAETSDFELATLLIKNPGISIDEKDTAGRTALDYAKNETMRHLLQEGLETRARH